MLVLSVREQTQSSLWGIYCKVASHFPTLCSLDQVFLEQKKLLKTGLKIAQFKRYVSLIEKETVDYFQKWGDAGKKGKFMHWE